MIGLLRVPEAVLAAFYTMGRRLVSSFTHNANGT